MTRKEDILDAMSGAYWFSMMDQMSAYYQVRMREEDVKFTAFQAPNGPCSSHGSLQRASYDAQVDIEAVSGLEEHEVVLR
ncbi:hypothetical protein PR002_g3501 [Phytophthora rubi]|nr:hypothetical protein PR002_g3501 [Phytophthora rubi]